MIIFRWMYEVWFQSTPAVKCWFLWTRWGNVSNKPFVFWGSGAALAWVIFLQWSLWINTFVLFFLPCNFSDKGVKTITKVLLSFHNMNCWFLTSSLTNPVEHVQFVLTLTLAYWTNILQVVSKDFLVVLWVFLFIYLFI